MQWMVKELEGKEEKIDEPQDVPLRMSIVRTSLKARKLNKNQVSLNYNSFPLELKWGKKKYYNEVNDEKVGPWDKATNGDEIATKIYIGKYTIDIKKPIAHSQGP